MKMVFVGLLMTACGDGEEKTTDNLHCNGDVNANLIVDDADCDGVLTADDCDDEDSNSTAIAEDGDCDGTLTVG